MQDSEAIAAGCSSRGFSCDRWIDPPGQCWEGFTHATDERVIVLKGRMQFEVDGRVLHPEPGAELLIAAGEVHTARNVGNSTARWLYGDRWR